VSRGMPRASGYFRTGYAQDLALTQTRLERASLLAFAVILAAFPFLATAFYLDLACQVFLAAIGALSWVGLTYTVKFVWGAMVDRIPLPLLGRADEVIE